MTLSGATTPGHSGLGSDCNEEVPRILQSSSITSASLSDCFGGARGVMVIVVRNGHGDTSSKPGRDWLHSS